MLLERLLLPISRKVLIYNLAGYDEYGQPQYAPVSNAPRYGTVRRTTTVEQRGDKAIEVTSLELILDGKLAQDYPLLGAQVSIEGFSEAFTIKSVRSEGASFMPVLVCQLEAAQ